MWLVFFFYLGFIVIINIRRCVLQQSWYYFGRSRRIRERCLVCDAQRRTTRSRSGQRRLTTPASSARVPSIFRDDTIAILPARVISAARRPSTMRYRGWCLYYYCVVCVITFVVTNVSKTIKIKTIIMNMNSTSVYPLLPLHVLHDYRGNAALTGPASASICLGSAVCGSLRQRWHVLSVLPGRLSNRNFYSFFEFMPIRQKIAEKTLCFAS